MIEIKRNIFKTFISSASDCDELRDASVKVVEEINRVIRIQNAEIESYVWEQNKLPEYLGTNNTAYQQKIYEEFGDICHIFIIFFWSKLGKGTVDEFKFFETTFKQINNDILFLCCHYGKEIPQILLNTKDSNYKELTAFLEENDSKWSPLGGRRGAIKDVNSFSEELRVAIMQFILKKLIKHP